MNLIRLIVKYTQNIINSVVFRRQERGVLLLGVLFIFYASLIMEYHLKIYLYCWIYFTVFPLRGQSLDSFYIVPKYTCESNGGYEDYHVLDAQFLVNGEEMKIGYAPGNYPMGYAIAKKWIGKKVCIQLKHPNFKKIKLDSAIIDPYNLRLFKKKESYYIKAGQPVLLTNGMQFISVKISSDANKRTPVEGQKIIDEICKKYKLVVGNNFRVNMANYEKDYGSGATEDMYGCLNQELNYTYWLRNIDSTDFEIKANVFEKIRSEEFVEWVAIPQSFYENVTNGITIEFKKKTSSKDIERIIKKYKLKYHFFHKSRKTDYEEHYFTTTTLIPNNKLMQKLMKEAVIKSATPKSIAYATCC